MIYEYKHMEYFDNWKKPDLKNAKNGIVLYGAGRRGAIAAHSLRKRGIDFLCFVDSDPLKCNQEYCGKVVITQEEFYENYRNCMVLITTSLYTSVVEELERHGIYDYYSCIHVYDGTDLNGFGLFSLEYTTRNLDLYYQVMSGLNDKSDNYLSEIYVLLTYACTLRCNQCLSYIPYEKERCADFDCDRIVQSLQDIAKGYDFIESISLYGGEPLIYKEFPRLLQDVLEIKNIERICIITNGTVIPSEETLKIMSSSKRIYVRISDYGQYSRKTEELCTILSSEGIRYEVTDYGAWNKAPVLGPKDKDESITINKIKTCCAQSAVLYLLEDKLFICQLVSYATTRNILPVFEDSYVDIMEYKGSPDALKNAVQSYRQTFLDGVPKTACKFCVYDAQYNHEPVAEQITEVLEFSKVDFTI